MRYAVRGGAVVLEDEARGLLRWRGWRGAREELGRAVHNTLIPRGVTADYLAYTRWRFTQRIFSSALAVLSTQSMLQAVGVGAKRSLPAAAAVNWVLKDGLGRLGKLATSAQFSQAFDSELKRFRFSEDTELREAIRSSMIHSGSVDPAVTLEKLVAATTGMDLAKPCPYNTFFLVIVHEVLIL